MVQSLAWQRESSIYPLLIVATGGQLPPAGPFDDVQPGIAPGGFWQPSALVSEAGAYMGRGGMDNRGSRASSARPMSPLSRSISVGARRQSLLPSPLLSHNGQILVSNPGSTAGAVCSPWRNSSLGLKPLSALGQASRASQSAPFLSKGTATVPETLRTNTGEESPPDSPVSGRLTIAPLPLLDGGSPMTPRKRRWQEAALPLPQFTHPAPQDWEAGAILH